MNPEITKADKQARERGPAMTLAQFILGYFLIIGTGIIVVSLSNTLFLLVTGTLAMCALILLIV